MEERDIKIGTVFYLQGETTAREVKHIRQERDCVIYSDDGDTWYSYAQLCFEPFVLQITFETLDGCTAYQLIHYLHHQLKPTLYRAIRSRYKLPGGIFDKDELPVSEMPVTKREYRLVNGPMRQSKNRIHARYLEVTDK